VKTKLVLIVAMFTVLVSSAQTNSIIFPQLLSSTNTVLMTNAEFRQIAVPKIYFKNDAGYRSFYPGELNSNVLSAIGTSFAKIAAQQAAIIAAHQKYLAAVAAAKAEQERQRQIAIKQAAIAEAAYQQQLQKQQELHGQNFYYTTPRESVGIGAP
jgi:hypothetical protein